MLFKKSKKIDKKIMARLRMRIVQRILLAIITHKKNTKLIKLTAPHVRRGASKKSGLRAKLGRIKKFILPVRKRAKDKW